MLGVVFGRRCASAVRGGPRLGLAALLVGGVALAAPSSALAAGWSAPGHIGVSDADLESVSCASVSFCVAVDTRGNAFTYSGSSWSAAEDIDGQVGLDSVSCPLASFCVAVDGAGSVLTYNGSSWSAPTYIEEGTPLVSVSCPSASFCVAVDGIGNALTYDGGSWSAPVVLDRAGNGLTGVSCPSASFCAAVDVDGKGFAYSLGSWSAPHTITIHGGLSSVSCPSASFCVASDGYGGGTAYNYNGSSWSEPDKIDVGDEVGINSVSCPSASFCVAVSGGGDAFTYDGSSWSAPSEIVAAAAPPSVLVSVSCPSALFCAAVTEFGDALTYHTERGSGTAVVGRAHVTGTKASVRVGCRGARGATCKVGLALSVTETAKGGKVVGVSASARKASKVVVLGAATVTLTTGQSRTVEIALNRTGNRLLAKLHRLKAKFVASQAGRTVSSQTITYTQPK